jgi:hypothetical protein
MDVALSGGPSVGRSRAGSGAPFKRPNRQPPSSASQELGPSRQWCDHHQQHGSQLESRSQRGGAGEAMWPPRLQTTGRREHIGNARVSQLGITGDDAPQRHHKHVKREAVWEAAGARSLSGAVDVEELPGRSLGRHACEAGPAAQLGIRRGAQSRQQCRTDIGEVGRDELQLDVDILGRGAGAGRERSGRQRRGRRRRWRPRRQRQRRQGRRGRGPRR